MFLKSKRLDILKSRKFRRNIVQDQQNHLINQNSIQKNEYSHSDSKHSKFATQRLLKDSDQPSHLVSQNSIQLKDKYSYSKHSKFVMQKLLKSNQDLHSHNVQVVQDMLNQASKEIRKNLQRQDELHKVVLLHSEKHQLHKRV